MLLSVLGDTFQKRFGVSICAANYGFKSLHSLLESLSDYFTMKGKKQKRIVCLNRETAGKNIDLLFLQLTGITIKLKRLKFMYSKFYLLIVCNIYAFYS